MKVSFATTLLCALSTGLLANGRIIDTAAEEEQKEVHERIELFLAKRCEKNGTPEDLQRALEKFRNLKSCVRTLLPLHTEEDDEDLEETCMENRKAVDTCFDEFVDAITSCFDPQEQYVGPFLKDSFSAYTKYFCNHSQILTITELLETNMAKCLNRFAKNNSINPQLVCYGSAKMSKHEEKGPITKQELCRDLDEIYACYERLFKEHCEDAPKVWEFEAGLLDAMRSPC